tara:strand:+ start:776 stop:1447 length:672 start_codon:yes stop_codon:yes gene_type:complete
MAYFREFPNINYVSLLPDRNKNEERILVKNIFKRAKLRTDIKFGITMFERYQVEENMRPEAIANRIYQDPELDWVILLVNNITNVRDQWPLSNNDLYNYMLDKYGETGLTDAHHYETVELKDSDGRIMLQGGLVVDDEFKFRYSVRKSNGDLTDPDNINPVQVITNLAYEQRENDKKRQIRILKPAYVAGVVNDLRNVMKYNRSTQYVNRNTIRTYNPRVAGV